MKKERMPGRPTPVTDQIRREHATVLAEIRKGVAMRDSKLPSMVLEARAFDAVRATPKTRYARKPSNFDLPKPKQKPLPYYLISTKGDS